MMEGLKAKARVAGLWNLFMPHEYGQFSPGLTNLEYAPLAELMGRVYWASEVFNCSAPDTGNMEVLARYGNAGQQERWLQPLLAGTMRSAYLMTDQSRNAYEHHIPAVTTLRYSITFRSVRHP